MYAKLYIIFGFFLFQMPFSIAQTPSFEKNFDAYTKTAEFLYFYDYLAWHSSDSIKNKGPQAMDTLGKYWFVYFDANQNPHAVYGKYENDLFQFQYHFILNENQEIRETKDSIDQSICRRFCRAIDKIYEIYGEKLAEIPILYNHYIYFQSDTQIAATAFPAFQGDQIAPFGYEVYLLLDAEAERLQEDRSYFSPKGLRAYDLNKDKDLVLDYGESSELRLGSIFYTYYYTRLGFPVVLHSATHAYSLIEAKSKNATNLQWIGLEKEEKNKKKKK